MKLGRREERFIHRLVVLAIVAFVMGIGVVVIKDSQEMQRLIEPSRARDLLLLLAPLSGLAMTGYSLSNRVFSSGGLLAEFLATVGAYSLFLSVVIPSFIKRELVSSEACRFWQLSCEETLLIRDDKYSFLFGALAVGLLCVSLWQARILKLSRRG